MDIKDYKLLTVTHKKTPLEKISHFIIQHENDAILKANLVQLKKAYNFQELLYVPTCNRVLFLMKASVELTPQFIQSFFQSINPNLSADFILQNVCLYQGEKAVEHLFRVAASIDSLIIGERQILKQIRARVQQGIGWGLVQKDIRFLNKQLVEVAKEVFSTTKIGEKQVSVVSIAMQKLLQSDLPKQAKILLVGAGQTNQLVAKFLLKYNYTNVTVFNRTQTKAQQLAANFQGTGHALADLANYQGGFDCLIICTGATKAILDKPLYQQLIGEDTTTKLVIDLAIPNNVVAIVPRQFPIKYITINLLKEMAAENLSFRRREIDKVEKLIALRLAAFQTKFNQRTLINQFQYIPTKIKNISHQAVHEVFNQDIAQLSEKEQALILKMMKYMEKKCVSIPMQIIKQKASVIS